MMTDETTSSKMVIRLIAVGALDSGYRPSEFIVVDAVVIEASYSVRRSLLIVELISRTVDRFQREEIRWEAR